MQRRKTLVCSLTSKLFARGSGILSDAISVKLLRLSPFLTGSKRFCADRRCCGEAKCQAHWEMQRMPIESSDGMRGSCRTRRDVVQRALQRLWEGGASQRVSETHRATADESSPESQGTATQAFETSRSQRPPPGSPKTGRTESCSSLNVFVQAGG